MQHLIEQLQGIIADNGDLQLLTSKIGCYQNLRDLFEWKDGDGNCLLHLCVSSCRLDCLEQYFGLLSRMSLDTGKYVNKTNHYGRTPLHLASFCGWDSAVERLLRLHEIEIDKQTNAGCTPLYFACCRGHFSIVQMLLQSHANPNIQTKASSTSLIAATLNDHLPLVKALLENGASSNLRNADGRTALHIAAEMNNREMVDLLISYGGMVSTEDQAGLTPNDILLSHEEKAKLCSSITLEASSLRYLRNNNSTKASSSSTSDGAPSSFNPARISPNLRNRTTLTTPLQHGSVSTPSGIMHVTQQLSLSGRLRDGNFDNPVDGDSVPSRSSSSGSSKFEDSSSTMPLHDRLPFQDTVQST